MRLMGHNVLAIIVAAIAIYAIEFLIFAVAMTPDQFMSLSGYGSGDMSRMPFGALPPILAAIGLSLVIKWRGKPGWLAGLMTGVYMAICFGVAISMYAFVYGPNTPAYVAVDLAHYVVCYGVAGAVLGAWR